MATPLAYHFCVKIWIAKNSEVPIHDQLVTQLTLGIAAGDYRPGTKIPSRSEIARRFDLHPNTVGAAYRSLVRDGLLEFRKGSGFYVAESAVAKIEGARKLDHLIDDFFSAASELGFSRDAIVERIKQGKRSDRSQRLVVVEPDDGLRHILVHELSAQFPNTVGVTWDEFLSSLPFDGALLTAMFDEQPKIEEVLTDGQQCIYLKGRSVASAMSDQRRPASGEVVAVASGWEGFINFARVMLLAANIEPGNLVCRSTADDGWQDAISHASMVICDSLTADLLNGDQRTRAFRVISDESLAEISSVLHD